MFPPAIFLMFSLFPLLNMSFFPDIPFPSHLVSLPLLTHSLFLSHNLTEVRRKSGQWLVSKELTSDSQFQFCFSPSAAYRSEILSVSTWPSRKGKGELLVWEISLDRVTPHSHLLSKASFPIRGIFSLWLHWEHIHKVSKSNIWCRKKAYIGWAFHIISANFLFPTFIHCNLCINQFTIITTIQPCLSASLRLSC